MNKINKEAKKGFWDFSARNYDKSAGRVDGRFKLFCEKIKTHLNKDMHLLELATGTGNYAIALAPYCKQVDATDFSEKMIEQAKTKHCPENVRFSIANAMDLTFPDASFDAALISFALHVIPDPDRVLKNVERVLNDDGILIASTFIRSGKLLDPLLGLAMKIMGFKFWTLDQYQALFLRNQWQILSCDFVPSGPFQSVVVVVKKNNTNE